jgi:hypothetical protein
MLVGYRGRVPTAIPDSDLARLLPGSWTVAATNFPMWLTGKRVDPVLHYDLLGESPLRLKDTVRFSTDAGEKKSIVGVDRGRNGLFTWRGRGLLRMFASHWSVTGVNESRTVLAIQYERTLATPAGIDIVVRADVAEPEVRSIVAANTARFGLSPEAFASLYWFGHDGRP